MNIPKYSLLSSFTIFFDLEKITFEIFNISENNLISVELAKVLGYMILITRIFHGEKKCLIISRILWPLGPNSGRTYAHKFLLS
jgi:hypothetical protein